MANVSRLLTRKLRLTVHAAQSAVARPAERSFLGFRLAHDGSLRHVAPQALTRLKRRVRDLTRRTRGVSLPQLLEPWARYRRGWRQDVGFCQTPRELAHLDAWRRQRSRRYLWRQWQNGRNRFQARRWRGVPKLRAAVAAGSPTGSWLMARHPAVQHALRPAYFDTLGLPRLATASQA
jgi:RNA-directed DNA polymerase